MVEFAKDTMSQSGGCNPALVGKHTEMLETHSREISELKVVQRYDHDVVGKVELILERLKDDISNVRNDIKEVKNDVGNLSAVVEKKFELFTVELDERDTKLSNRQFEAEQRIGKLERDDGEKALVRESFLIKLVATGVIGAIVGYMMRMIL